MIFLFMVVFSTYLNTDRTLAILFNNLALKNNKRSLYRCITTLTIIYVYRYDDVFTKISITKIG